MNIENYLLCRPHGGLNDMLVQIAFCRNYAARSSRSLVIDMNRGGWKDDFQRYFVPLPTFAARWHDWTEETADRLAGLETVQPSQLKGRIRDYPFTQKGSAFLLAGTDVRLGFDAERDYDERLLVHEQCGGGLESIELLRYVRFTAETANGILQRILPLGGDYDAIHVRHTDMKTDYRDFLKKIAPALAGRRVLLCTDSHRVQLEAPGLLAKCAAVMTLAAVPDTGGMGLHYHNSGNIFDRNLGSLADLVALACSRKLYFAGVRDGDGIARVSGFSLLAEGLHQQQGVIRVLLSAADEALRARFEASHDASRWPDLSLRQRLIRRLVDMGQLFWNREALKRAKRLRRHIAATAQIG
ncbi:hypothetical protein [Martelella sp. HB161492]|uniref:hypothetical protein n=1 Tax=Martelella sp. HB161492 TaxID=2720726 RepID=UPI00159230D0|nr:hypothetical protein [Martelella sp. HB161492]